MRREKNLFPRITETRNLFRSFVRAAHGKHDRREVQDFEHDLETRLREVRRDLENGDYLWGVYRRFLIRDPKRREIRAAPFRDRVVHHALFTVLDPIFQRGYIADTFACLPGRGAHRAARRFWAFMRARRGVGYAVHGDIKSYFASVDHAVLLASIARRIGDARLLLLLRSLIEHGADASGKGMPIGNLTSQMFANLYLSALDHFVKETLRVRHYVRYMDDFVLVLAGRDEARARLADVERFLDERLRLSLNPRRVTVAPLGSPQDFLGFVMHADGHIRIRRPSVRRLWRRIPLLERRLQCGEVAWSHARASVASWHGLAAHADAFRLSRAIFTTRDVRNLGKRLLVRVAERSRRAGTAGSRVPHPVASAPE